jgi:hypothetical protein
MYKIKVEVTDVEFEIHNASQETTQKLSDEFIQKLQELIKEYATTCYGGPEITYTVNINKPEPILE